MEQLNNILQQATTAIGREYFLLPIHGADPVHRERVYCYELYHQMRLRWPAAEDCPYRLNGEIDKAGHPYFENERGTPKPDLLVHVPGAGDNCAVIEVKSSRARAKEIRKDLQMANSHLRGNWSLVQPSTVPPPPVRIKTYRRCWFVNSQFWYTAAQPGMDSMAVIVMLKIE
jgi:hypothetical protein